MYTSALVWSLADGTRVFPQSLFCTDSPRAPEKELCQGGVWSRPLGLGRGCRPCAAPRGPAVCVSLSLAVCLDLTPQPFVNTFSFLPQEPEEKAHDAAGDAEPAAGGQ